MKRILINLSGHPAPRGAEEAFDKVVSVPVPTVDLARKEALAEAAQSLVSQALEDAEVKEALLRGEAAVILPGSSALAGTVLAVLEGVSGTLPELRWAVRDKGVYLLSEGLDLATQRVAGRALRRD